jgi:hypothetical protein
MSAIGVNFYFIKLCVDVHYDLALPKTIKSFFHELRWEIMEFVVLFLANKW